MSLPRAGDEDYINFLLASQGRHTCTEAARSQPEERVNRPSHDPFTRLLLRTPQDTGALWEEAEHMVSRNSGVWSSTTQHSTSRTRRRSLFSLTTGAGSITGWSEVSTSSPFCGQTGRSSSRRTTESTTNRSEAGPRTNISAICSTPQGRGGSILTTPCSTAGTRAWIT
jgi:hypothetical protein